MSETGVAPPISFVDNRCEVVAASEIDGPRRPDGLSSRLRDELLIALGVFAAAIVFLWPLRCFLSFNADEGITLVSADRILRGQVPYRDFFIFITPGSAYLTALWFRVFGASYLVPRSILLVYAGVFGSSTYWLARISCSRRGALFASALLIAGCLPSRFFALHNWDSTLFALLTVCCAIWLLEHASRPIWSLLGCAAAFTCLTEQSKGAGLLLGLMIAACALWLPERRRANGWIGNAAWCAAGFAIPVAITFAYFASQHATKEMLEAWIWPLQHYSGANRIAYGALPMTGEELGELYSSGPWAMRAFIIAISSPMFLISLLALLVTAATAYGIAIRWSGGRSRALDARVVGGCVFLGMFLSTLKTGRADLNHVIYLTPLFVYLVPSIFETNRGGNRLFQRATPIVAGLLLAAFAGFGLVTILKAVTPGAQMESRRGRVKLAYPDEVLAYVQQHVPAGQHMYVHPYQASYSFMTGTLNPARVSFLQAGMNTPQQYEMTVADLARDRPAYVLLNPDFSDKISATWPATPAETLAADPVEDYILLHYRSCRLLNANPPRLWKFYFMARKDLPCSGN
jgi:hypothetical protein